MPTLLAWGDLICKVQIAFKTKVQGYFDQRSEHSLLYREKKQKPEARLDQQSKLKFSTSSFTFSLSTEPGHSCPGVN